MNARVVNFADGFTSASAPSVSGGVQSDYKILNNASNVLLFTADQSVNKTIFASYQLIRFNDNVRYTQNGDFTMAFDGINWKITEGLFSSNPSNDMLRLDAIENDRDVQLEMDPTTGELNYNSGNMVGPGYDGDFKLILTRVS